MIKVKNQNTLKSTQNENYIEYLHTIALILNIFNNKKRILKKKL